MKDFNPDMRVVLSVLLFQNKQGEKQSIIDALNLCSEYYHVKIEKRPKINLNQALLYFSDMGKPAKDRISKLYYSLLNTSTN